jgi:hypothetical protein
MDDKLRTVSYDGQCTGRRCEPGAYRVMLAGVPAEGVSLVHTELCWPVYWQKVLAWCIQSYVGRCTGRRYAPGAYRVMLEYV